MFATLNSCPQNSVVSEETSVDKSLKRFIQNPALSLENWKTQILAYDDSEAPEFATDDEGTLALKSVNIFKKMT